MEFLLSVHDCDQFLYFMLHYAQCSDPLKMLKIMAYIRQVFFPICGSISCVSFSFLLVYQKSNTKEASLANEHTLRKPWY